MKATALQLKAMKSLRTLDVHNLSTLGGTLDVSTNTRLESLDARGTSITGVSLPNQEFLKSVKLPATMTALRLENFKGLSELTLEGWEKLETFYMDQKTCPNLNSLIFIEKLKNAKGLNSVTILGVNWADITVETLTWLLDRQVKITGRIAMNSGEKIDATLKMRIVSSYGNVDDESNSLYISYTINPITQVSVIGKSILKETGTYMYKLQVNPSVGNNIKSVEWKIRGNNFASIEKNTGIVTVNKVGTEENDDVVYISVVLTLIDNTTILSVEKKVRLYDKAVTVGDYIFNDASYSDELEDGLIPVAIVFYIEPKEREWVLATDLKTYSSSYYWGIAKNSFSTIELADPNNQNYDVFNVFNLTKKWFRSDNILNDSNILDSDNMDNDGFAFTGGNNTLNDIGFTEISSILYMELSSFLDDLGLTTGDMISQGQLNTLRIIKHRNRILQDSNINLPIPIKIEGRQTERESLIKNINDVVAAHDGKNTYEQYYYSLASLCYTYEPTYEINDKLKAHHWFLASSGELIRLMWYMLKSITEPNSKYAIFSKAINLAVMKRLNSVVGSSLVFYNDSSEVDTITMVSINTSNNTVNSSASFMYNKTSSFVNILALKVK